MLKRFDYVKFNLLLLVSDNKKNNNKHYGTPDNYNLPISVSLQERIDPGSDIWDSPGPWNSWEES